MESLLSPNLLMKNDKVLNKKHVLKEKVDDLLSKNWPRRLVFGHTPIGGVVIRDPVSETTPKLPEVVGKGKAIVTEEQVAHFPDLICQGEKATDQSGIEAAAPKGDKEQGKVASSTVTSGVGISVRKQDQTGSTKKSN
ncbi:hypothetical protein Tco_0670369 [Tanacetum coccineum]